MSSTSPGRRLRLGSGTRPRVRPARSPGRGRSAATRRAARGRSTSAVILEADPGVSTPPSPSGSRRSSGDHEAARRPRCRLRIAGVRSGLRLPTTHVGRRRDSDARSPSDVSPSTSASAADERADGERPRIGLPNRNLTPARPTRCDAGRPVDDRLQIRMGLRASGLRPPTRQHSSSSRSSSTATRIEIPSHYQEDHLVPLELGGAPRDKRNLWPEPNSAVLPDGTAIAASRRTLSRTRCMLACAPEDWLWSTPSGCSRLTGWRRGIGRPTRGWRYSTPAGRCLVRLRDLPDVAARIAEAGRPDAPRPIHRAVEELHSPLRQLGAHGIDVVDREREDRPGSGLA